MAQADTIGDGESKWIRIFWGREHVGPEDRDPGSVVEVSFVLCCCFLARAPGSLAGGFLVAVAGRARFVLLVLVETSVGMVLFFVSPFHLHNGLRPN